MMWLSVFLFSTLCLFLPSSGLAAGEAPAERDLGIWYRFIDEYSAYFQQHYGPEIKSRYQLYLREREEMRSPGYAACTPPVTGRRTLTRWVDSIIFEGRHLARLLGRPIDNLRVQACREGRWQPIPYQVDEMTADGARVLPLGPANNASLGDGKLDQQDEIVLMAHDLGDRVEQAAWPLNAASGEEVEATDPVTGEKGWFYVFSFEKSPPAPSPLRYRHAFIPVEELTGYLAFSAYYLGQGKTLLYHGKKYNQIFYDGLYQSPLAGGTGTDYVDRMKWRLKIRFLFGAMKISFDEDSLTGEFLAWSEGPVRGTYRVVAVANLPMGLKSPRVVADVIQVGENIVSTTTELRVPFNPGYVITDMSTRIGTDLNSEARGMQFYNSNNLSGALIDGKPDPSEAGLSRKQDHWRLIYGPQATLMNRSYWSPNFAKQAKSIEAYLTDNLEKKDPPEGSEGQFGAVSSEATVGNLKAGAYAIGLEWYFLNDFYRPGKQPNLEIINEYLRYQDSPLQLKTEAGTFSNRCTPSLGKPWD